MEAQDLSSDGKESLQGDVMESLGESKEAQHEAPNEPHGEQGTGEHDDLPEGVKARLGRQEKRHQREMRQMREQMQLMQMRMTQPNYSEQNPEMSQYSDAGAPQNPSNNVSEQIREAVSYALKQKEMQERKAKEAESAAHVHRQKVALHDHLNQMQDKYDDFHDVVLGDGVPITPHMAEFAVTLPKTGPGSAGEVFYKLGKNKAELERISKLHPVDQASEMVKLSHALIAGEREGKSNPQSRPIGTIKHNPVTNTHSITDKTPVSELRKRMKAGWK